MIHASVRLRLPVLFSAVLAGIVSIASPAGVRAQEGSRVYVRGGVGVFGAFPDDFSEPWCEQSTWGGTLGVGYALTRSVALEAGLTAANGLGGVTCAIPGIPEPPPGSTYGQERFADGIRENSFRAVSVAVALTPWASAGQAVEARLGGSWMADKHLFAGTGGFAYRFRLGGHELEAGYEAWLLRVPRDLEAIHVTLQGDHVLLSSLRRSETAAALLVSVVYRYRLR